LQSESMRDAVTMGKFQTLNYLERSFVDLSVSQILLLGADLQHVCDKSGCKVKSQLTSKTVINWSRFLCKCSHANSCARGLSLSRMLWGTSNAWAEDCTHKFNTNSSVFLSATQQFTLSESDLLILLLLFLSLHW
jgi:hypothetical protein